MNFFEAFRLIDMGHIIEDRDGIWYSRNFTTDTLEESYDQGKNWQLVLEFGYNNINQKWTLIR